MTVEPEIDLVSAGRGSVTAPAGHGKTQVIAATIAKYPERRFLVLTHTNAGVSSLRRRITRTGTAARIETISSLALRLVRAFPTKIGWVDDTEIDHAAALTATHTLLRRPTVASALLHGYDHLIVDEYQDCTAAQHRLVELLAHNLPAVVLGDPLQAIFGFDKSDPLVPWTEVEQSFPPVGDLTSPHRWAKTNPDLGAWLRSTRIPLQTGIAIPRPPVAAEVQVRKLPRPPAQGTLLNCLADRGTTAIIIPDSRKDWQIAQYAKSLKGRGQVHESVEKAELLAAAHKISTAGTPAATLLETINFTAITTTGVTDPSPVTTLRKHLQQDGAPKKRHIELTRCAHSFLETGCAADLADFLDELVRSATGRTFRPELLATMRSALRSSSTGPVSELPTAVRHAIDTRRNVAAPASQRSVVGSTLRLKGLEYDRVVLVDPAQVPSAEHFYVALSRARSSIVLAVPPEQNVGPWFR